VLSFDTHDSSHADLCLSESGFTGNYASSLFETVRVSACAAASIRAHALPRAAASPADVFPRMSFKQLVSEQAGGGIMSSTFQGQSSCSVLFDRSNFVGNYASTAQVSS